MRAALALVTCGLLVTTVAGRAPAQPSPSPAAPAPQTAAPAPQPSSSPAAVAAPVAPLSPEREQRLRARAVAYYEGRRTRDQRVLYDLHEPAYRARVDFSTFAQQTTVRLRFTLLKFEVVSVEAQPDEAALVKVALRMDLGRFGDTPVDPVDRWVWRDGDWWITFREIDLPFPK
ncbi:MAG: hypothetical protein JNM38_20675 [Acidobacteria bacterium]|nr:hypothetical protein [Acidobacteriota bacterium]